MSERYLWTKKKWKNEKKRKKRKNEEKKRKKRIQKS